MSKTIFNNLISIEIPDNFKQLSEEENEKFFAGDLMRISFQNPQKHILFSISKTKDSFLNRIINPAAVLSGALSNMEKNLKNYQLIETCESTIFDKPAMTACFSYSTNSEDIKQYGELSVFKFKKAFYVIYCLSKFESKEESKALFKQFRDSFAPINS